MPDGKGTCHANTWNMKNTEAPIFCRYESHVCLDCFEVATLAKAATIGTDAEIREVMHDQKSGLQFNIAVRNPCEVFRAHLDNLLLHFYGEGEGVASEYGAVVSVHEARYDPEWD